jgi:hypothetical protein
VPQFPRQAIQRNEDEVGDSGSPEAEQGQRIQLGTRHKDGTDAWEASSQIGHRRIGVLIVR